MHRRTEGPATRTTMRAITTSLTGLGLTATLLGAVSAHAPPYARRSNALPPLSGKHGGVATEVGECSDIGVDTLKAGGSAADAIISSALCVGTIAAYHSGIGGGGFMIVRFPSGKGHGHDYEMASLTFASTLN